MEYTGIAPFAVLVFLCLFSAPWFRHVCYEFFVHSHIAAAIAFLGAMFWHCENIRDSWYYLWATVTIWIVQLAARAWDKTSMFEFQHKRRSGVARMQLLDNDLGQAAMLRLSVRTSMHWSPGQHAFLRFPKLALLDNHPFTIASVPKKHREKISSADEQNELVFLVRPYGGVTKRLLKHVEKHSPCRSNAKESSISETQLEIKGEENLQVLIDGPYGGLEQHRAMHRLYDHIILVAGGGGISAMLPWLSSLSRRIAALDEPCRVQRVDLIWCVRHASAQQWIEAELRECLEVAGAAIHVDIYVTNDGPDITLSSGSASEDITSDDEKPRAEDTGTETKADWKQSVHAARSTKAQSSHFHTGRPHLPSLLPSIVSHRRTMIMACGPESLKIDLSNTAAKLQSRVLNNEADEIVLHTETFGW